MTTYSPRKKMGGKSTLSPNKLGDGVRTKANKIWGSGCHDPLLHISRCFYVKSRDIHTEYSKQSNETHSSMCLGRAGRFGQH